MSEQCPNNNCWRNIGDPCNQCKEIVEKPLQVQGLILSLQAEIERLEGEYAKALECIANHVAWKHLPESVIDALMNRYFHTPPLPEGSDNREKED